MIKKRGLPNQNALRIIFQDPDTGQIDVVYLCEMNLLGVYPVRRLQELSSVIESLLAESGAGSQLDDSVEQSLPKKGGFILQLVRAVMGTFGSREAVCKQFSTVGFQSAIPGKVGSP